MPNSKHIQQIIRCDLSSYFSPQYLAQEKSLVIDQLHLKYAFLPKNPISQIDHKAPFILLTSSQSPIEQLSLNWDSCESIVHLNSGYDNFSSDFVKKFKKPIILGNEIRAQAVAEAILQVLWSYQLPLPHTMSWNAARQWPRTLLSEKKILIIGMGMIGTIIKNSLSPLGCQLHFYDPYQELPSSKTKYQDKNWPKVDIVILAASLNPHNIHLIDQEFLKGISPNALIINMARGKLIQSHDLKSWLQENSNAHAVLDVFEKEPEDFHFFDGLKNITRSSHIAGVFNHIELKTLNFLKKVIPEILKKDIQQPLLNDRLKNGFLY
jgi:D-3-phosphoglycerate dehydrogenase